jgi:uncharacterized membrane protein YgcG
VLKEMAASQAAKALALCVFPVVGAAAITVGVPKIRHAVHQLTAPQSGSPHKRARLASREPAACPDATPVALANGPIRPIDLKEPDGIAMLPELTDPYTAARAVQASLPGDNGFIRSVPNGGGAGSSSSGIGGGGTGGGSSGGAIAVVPEPATWLQAIVGLGVAGTAIRMATRKRAEAVAEHVI